MHVYNDYAVTIAEGTKRIKANSRSKEAFISVKVTSVDKLGSAISANPLRRIAVVYRSKVEIVVHPIAAVSFEES